MKKLTPTQIKILETAARVDIVHKLQDELLLNKTTITDRGRVALLLTR